MNENDMSTMDLYINNSNYANNVYVLNYPCYGCPIRSHQLEDLHSAGWAVAVPSLIWPRRWSVEASRSKCWGSLSQARDFKKEPWAWDCSIIFRNKFEIQHEEVTTWISMDLPHDTYDVRISWFEHDQHGEWHTGYIGLQLENHQHLDFSHFQHGIQPGVARDVIMLIQKDRDLTGFAFFSRTRMTWIWSSKS